MTGLHRIAAAFAQTRADGRAALMPYLMAGYPNLEATRALVPALAAAGADLLELGVPFSDPIADGPTIQRAAHAALQQGVTPDDCLRLVHDLRCAGVEIPCLLMGYYNPIYTVEPAAYARAAREAGADGLIVPDLPVEESAELAAACRAEGLALIYLVAPNTPDDRLARIAAAAQGFLYLVSRPGTTGVRERLPEGLAEYVARVRARTDLPLALGFGIGAPAQAREAARLVDGVVVGSAVVERAGQSVQAAAGLVQELAHVMRDP